MGSDGTGVSYIEVGGTLVGNSRADYPVVKVPENKPVFAGDLVGGDRFKLWSAEKITYQVVTFSDYVVQVLVRNSISQAAAEVLVAKAVEQYAMNGTVLPLKKEDKSEAAVTTVAIKGV